MGIWDGLSEILGPHIAKMDEHLAFHTAAIHGKLGAIERAVSDLGRGDIGNKWQRIVINRKFAENEEFEVATVPINEIFLIQAISSDGVQEKSPPYVILANGILLESIVKEGLGFEGIGGNQVGLPGERLSVIARAAGSINCVITFIRMPYPTTGVSFDRGKGTERTSARNTHEISRDAIAERIPQTYAEPAPQTIGSEGRTG